MTNISADNSCIFDIYRIYSRINMGLLAHMDFRHTPAATCDAHCEDDSGCATRVRTSQISLERANSKEQFHPIRNPRLSKRSMLPNISQQRPITCIKMIKLFSKRPFGQRNLHILQSHMDDLNSIYDSIRAQKFKDIVVIQTKFNANPRHLILASSFNARHLMNGTENVNKHFKTSLRNPDQEFARLSISSEWNVLDFSSVVVHLFSRNCREHFDIEQLWAVGEEFDDLVNQEVPVYEKISMDDDSPSVGLGLRVPDTSGS